MAGAPEHLVDLAGLDRGFVLELFAEADRLRAVRGTPKAPRPLAGKTAALVFHKPSLRTRTNVQFVRSLTFTTRHSIAAMRMVDNAARAASDSPRF